MALTATIVSRINATFHADVSPPESLLSNSLTIATRAESADS
jgi:hypothetical protein